MRGRLGLLALCVPALLYAGLARNLSAAVVVLGLLLLAQRAGPQVQLGLLGHGLLAGMAAGAAALLGMLGPPAELTPILPLWSGMALGALLLSAARQGCADPPAGGLGTWALGLLALLCCGQTHVGAAYPAAVFLYLLLSLLALGEARSALPSEGNGAKAQPPLFDGDGAARTPWSGMDGRSRLVLLLLPVAATVVAAGLRWPLFPLQEWVQRQFDDSLGVARVGLSQSMKLGGLAGMLDSDAQVARVYGGRTDYLRGMVYNVYRGGAWTAREESKPVGLHVHRGPLTGAGVIRIEQVGRARGPYLLPQEVAELGTDIGMAVSDYAGLLQAGGDPGWTVFFRAGPRRVGVLGPPGPEDLQIPARLAPALSALANEWIAGAVTTEEKLLRIETRLSRYRYSLRSQRQRGLDPVMDFLQVNRQGHCEYFASAMALLARAVGIRARVVGGFRVAEYNRFGDYFVVRDRNAHAWVEAFVPRHQRAGGAVDKSVEMGEAGEWVTYDPTPGDGVPQNREHAMPLFSALADAIAEAGQRAVGRLGRWLTWQSTVPVILGLSGWLLWRRRRRRAHGRAQAAALGRPLPGFISLQQALSRRGVLREPWEPLERFALRVPDPEAAALIRQYADLRYGGIGTEEALGPALLRCAARLSKEARRA